MENLPSRITALITLFVFLFMSCELPVQPAAKNSGNEENAEIAPKPVYFYLDEKYEISETDTGRTGMVILNSEQTADFLVSSEEYGTDYVVRFFSGGGLAGTVYFDAGQIFPRRMIMPIDGNAVYIDFNNFSETENTFNMTVQYQGESENALLSFGHNLVDGIKQDDEITESQNDRINNLYVALSVWASVGTFFNAASGEQQQAPYTEDMARTMSANLMARGFFSYFFSGIANAFTAVFMGVSIIATIVGIIVASPIATAVLVTVAAITAVQALVIPTILNAIGEELDEKMTDSLDTAQQAGAVNVYISVSFLDCDNSPQSLVQPGDGGINENGLVDCGTKFLIPNRSLEYTENPSMIITMRIPSLNLRYLPVIASSEMEDMAADFVFTDPTESLDKTYDYKIKRKYASFSDKGELTIVIAFLQDVIINDNSDGSIFKNPYSWTFATLPAITADTEPTLHKDMFMLKAVNPTR
ncbi:MAG: hypothetical protein LBC89_02020 [Bacteroidales bacterium]|jgi:hypothetical protein|nr:hypothetical protein [Bacteroidales bacterium]